MPRMGCRLAPRSPPAPCRGPHGHTLITVLPSLGDSVDSDSQPFPSCPLRLVVPPGAERERSSAPGASSRRLLAAAASAHGALRGLGPPGRAGWGLPWQDWFPRAFLALTLAVRGNPAPPQQPHVHPSRGQAVTRPVLIFKVLRPSCPPSTHTLYVSRLALRHKVTRVPPACELLTTECVVCIFLPMPSTEGFNKHSQQTSSASHGPDSATAQTQQRKNLPPTQATNALTRTYTCAHTCKHTSTGADRPTPTSKHTPTSTPPAHTDPHAESKVWTPGPTLSADLPWGVSGLPGSPGSFFQGTEFLPSLGLTLSPLEPLGPPWGRPGSRASEQSEVLRV